MSRHDEKAICVSVVIVSDYEEGDANWTSERACVGAFLADDPGVPMDVIVMRPLPDGAASRDVPVDFAGLAPKVSVRFEPCRNSAALKDAALKYTKGELVAVVEADCLPEPGWLKHLIAAMRDDPALDVVSGRTLYGTDTAMLRVMTLIDRGFIEQRIDGEYVEVSNNGALYRRNILEAHQYPDESSPFVSAELRGRRMREGGVRIGFEPRAAMRHAFGGISFLADLRRNKGYQTARRLIQDSQRFVGASAAWIALHSVAQSARADAMAVRCAGKNYVRRIDWPLLAIMFLAVRLPEFLGALSVRRPERFAAMTKYR